MDDKLSLTSLTIDANTTELPSDSKLVKNIAIALLKSIAVNKEDLGIQDLLTELNITKP